MGLLEAVFGFLGAKKQSDAIGKASQLDYDAAMKQLAFAKETQQQNRADLGPQREAGYSALDAMMSMVGLPRTNSMRDALGAAYKPPVDPNKQFYEWLNSGALGQGLAGLYRQSGFDPSVIPSYIQGRQSGGPTTAYQQYNLSETGSPEQFYTSGGYTTITSPQTVSGAGSGFVAPTENPGGQPGSYNFMADPGYNFRFNEGMRAIERSALAKGSYGGGTARQMVRYAQDYASGEYGNVFERLSRIAGYGGNANASTTQSNIYSGQMMQNAIGSGGAARATGAIAQGNAWANAINQLGDVNWGGVWDRVKGWGSSGSSGGSGQMGPDSDKKYLG